MKYSHGATEGIEIGATGIVTAPGKVLADMVSRLPPGRLELVCEATSLRIKSLERASALVYDVRVTPADEFPALPLVATADMIMPAERFLNVVTRPSDSDESEFLCEPCLTRPTCRYLVRRVSRPYSSLAHLTTPQQC